jgi:hypothetical protein
VPPSDSLLTAELTIHRSKGLGGRTQPETFIVIGVRKLLVEGIAEVEKCVLKGLVPELAAKIGQTLLVLLYPKLAGFFGFMGGDGNLLGTIDQQDEEFPAGGTTPLPDLGLEMASKKFACKSGRHGGQTSRLIPISLG